MRQIIVLTLVVAVVGSSAPSWAGSAAGSAFTTALYAPFKATFCILGGIGSGFTAIVSPPTAGRVAMATCGGSWFITPSMLRGHEDLKFVGDTSSSRMAATR
jgi:hypothetical protein